VHTRSQMVVDQSRDHQLALGIDGFTHLTRESTTHKRNTVPLIGHLTIGDDHMFVVSEVDYRPTLN
jgi:hypothetical protein